VRSHLHYIRRYQGAQQHEIEVSSSLILSRQIEAARNAADKIEIHTGEYANARAARAALNLDEVRKAARLASELGWVNAGHGLNYANIAPIRRFRD
jgi:pyridoxine 5'-phosphate synthase PdxJ